MYEFWKNYLNYYDITKYWTFDKIERYNTIMPLQLWYIRHKKCPICHKRVNVYDFNEKIEIDEYLISGMCKECQDDFFNN